MKKLTLAFLLAVATSLGCNTPEAQQEHRDKVAATLATRAEKRLPPNTKNFKALGNEWYYFEMEIDGRNRKFLYRSTGVGNDNVETVTELQP
jgi:hypothetical protein